MTVFPRLSGAVRSVNETIRDRTILRATVLERYKRSEVTRMVRFLNEQVLPDLISQTEERLARIERRGFDSGTFTTQRYRDMIDAQETILRSGMRRASGRHVEELQRFAVSESEWQRALISESAAPIEFDMRAPSIRTLKAVVTSQPLEGQFLREWWTGLGAETGNAVRRAINVGITQGETSAQIVRRLTGTRASGYTNGVLSIARRHAESIVRTAVSHVSSAARRETFKENRDVVKGEQFVATLDGRVTDVCASLDGQVSSVGRGPRPPMHFQCRSTLVPVLKSWKELGINLKEAPPGTRESMNGAVSAKITYSDWLKKQPHAFQNEVLGKGRADVFRRGKLPLKNFVDKRFRPLKLDELLEAERRVLQPVTPWASMSRVGKAVLGEVGFVGKTFGKNVALGAVTKLPGEITKMVFEPRKLWRAVQGSAILGGTTVYTAIKPYAKLTWGTVKLVAKTPSGTRHTVTMLTSTWKDRKIPGDPTSASYREAFRNAVTRAIRERTPDAMEKLRKGIKKAASEAKADFEEHTFQSTLTIGILAVPLPFSGDVGLALKSGFRAWNKFDPLELAKRVEKAI